MNERLWLLVCPHFLAEASAVIRQAGRANVQVATFPAVCVRPARNADEIGRRAMRLSHRSAGVAVLGSHCLVGVTRPTAAVDTVRVYRASRCLELVASADWLDTQIAAGAYLLTPGWLRRWRQHMAAWGFDQATARIFFAETAQRLVLLDTGLGAGSTMHLHALADFLALPAQVMPVGLQRFAAHLMNILTESDECGKLFERIRA